MGAFAGQLDANGLIEDVFHRSVHSAAHFRDWAADRYSSCNGTVLPGLFRCSSEFFLPDCVLGCCDTGKWQAVVCQTEEKNKVNVCCSSCQSIQTMEHEFYECPEYLSNTPAEAERTEEYEYEVQFRESEFFYWQSGHVHSFGLYTYHRFKLHFPKNSKFSVKSSDLSLPVLSSSSSAWFPPPVSLRLWSCLLPQVHQLCSPSFPEPEGFSEIIKHESTNYI